MGCSPWGREESDMTEKDTRTTLFTVALFTIASTWVREGNGTPLQYSCLENPMDGGAWKAAVHGVLRVGHD